MRSLSLSSVLRSRSSSLCWFYSFCSLETHQCKLTYMTGKRLYEAAKCDTPPTPMQSHTHTHPFTRPLWLRACGSLSRGSGWLIGLGAAVRFHSIKPWANTAWRVGRDAAVRGRGGRLITHVGSTLPVSTHVHDELGSLQDPLYGGSTTGKTFLVAWFTLRSLSAVFYHYFQSKSL